MENILTYKYKRKVIYLYIIAFLIIILYNAFLFYNENLSYGLIIIPFIIVFIIKPRLWIYFLAVYLPFETVILNFLPTDLVVFFRYGIEFFSYFVLLAIVCKNFIVKKKIFINKFDKFIILFIVVCVLSGLINNVSLKIFLLGLRWLIRYLVIYFIIRYDDWDINKIKKLLYFILGVGFIVEIIGVLQFFFRNTLDKILAPKILDLDFITIDITQGESKFAIYSTLGRYGEYGLFLTVITVILLSKVFGGESKKFFKVYLLLSIASVLISYSRQSVFALLTSFIIVSLLIKNVKIDKKKIIIILFVGFFALFIMFNLGNLQKGEGTINESISQRFISIFSKEFLEKDFEGQGRLYFLIKVNGIFLHNKPFIGYGVGMYGTRPAILYDTSVYDTLNIPIRFSMDVYWTSILGQIGIIGVISLLSIYITFYKESLYLLKKTNDSFVRIYCLMIILLIISVLFESFFGSNLSDRYQAFYIWLFFGMYDQIKKYVDQQNNLSN